MVFISFVYNEYWSIMIVSTYFCATQCADSDKTKHGVVTLNITNLIVVKNFIVIVIRIQRQLFRSQLR